MFSIQPSQWIWLVYIPIPNLAKKFRSFYTNWTYVTGNTYWRSWSQIYSNWWLQNMWIIVPLFYSNLKNIYSAFSIKNSFYGLPLSFLPCKITYIQTVLRHKRSQIWLFRYRFFFPHASAHSWLQQSRCKWPTTIRQYGLQPTVCDQIITNDDGDPNFGGLLPLQYYCRRFWKYHSSSFDRCNTFNSEEVRIVCSCK